MKLALGKTAAPGRVTKTKRGCIPHTARPCAPHRRSQLPEGTVKFFNEEKGYGFIKPDDSSNDVFVHCSNVNTADKRLVDNQRVSYEIGEGRKGPEARDVVPLDGE